MLRIAALLAGTALLAVRPLAAQTGLASVHRSVTLTATRLASVSVALAGGVSSSSDQVTLVPVRTSWNADPAEPFGVSLAAYFDAPVRDGESRGGSAGGPKSRPIRTDEIGEGPLALPAQPVSAAGARGGRTDDLQVRIDLLGRFDSSPGTLNLVAITQ